MKLLMIFGIVAFVILVIAIFRGISITRRTQSDPLQKEFLKGTVPVKLNGAYRGTTTGPLGSWQGKEIDQASATGINIFAEGKRYPFKIYQGKGIRDGIDVLRIDYNIPGNPLWVRFILDELVQVGEEQYLGKVHVRILPGVSIALTYFTLER